jgi:hypothetical protein
MGGAKIINIINSTLLIVCVQTKDSVKTIYEDYCLIYVTPCSLVVIYLPFGETYCFLLRGKNLSIQENIIMFCGQDVILRQI